MSTTATSSDTTLQHHNGVSAILSRMSIDDVVSENMQIEDSKHASLIAETEGDMYDAWNTTLQTDVDKINDDPDNTALQSQYNLDSSKASSNENQEDGMLKAAQDQVSADSSGLQSKIQAMQQILQVQAQSVTLLGQIIS